MVMETEFSDFADDPQRGGPAAFLAAPVLSEGVLLGVVALQLNNKEIYESVNDYSGLGETGEIIVCAQSGADVIFVAPVRHDPDAAFRRRATMGSTLHGPLREAGRGINGLGALVDYRGHETLSVWRYVPSLRFGLMVKLDTDETLAPLERLRHMVIGIVLLTLALVVFASALATRSLSAPILRLTGLVRRISAGDLNQEITPTGRDEVGELGRTFNKMTANLRAVYGKIEDEVKHRTQELTEANAALANEILERKQAEQQLLDKIEVVRRQQEAIRAMSTPILEVGDRVLALPVIGIVDTERAAQMMEDLLVAIKRTRAQFTILDLTGVEVMDTTAVNHLLRVVRAAGMLGTRCLISGISPNIAATIVSLNLTFHDVVPFPELASALNYALQRRMRQASAS
jgi:anti-anti-sigma regulatory factor/HAMP domain-containing protein